MICLEELKRSGSRQCLYFQSEARHLKLPSSGDPKKRLIRELNALRETLKIHGIKLIHVTGCDNPADALTKWKKFSNAMTEMLRTNKYNKRGGYSLTDTFYVDVTPVFLDTYTSRAQFLMALSGSIA